MSMVVDSLRRLVRRAAPNHLVIGAVAAAALATGAFLLSAALADDGPPSGIRSIDPAALGASDLALDAEGVLDSDLDGVPDALENILYGSDPLTWNSSGTPIPDGWLTRYGLDPADPGIAQRPGATPPADALPAAYGNHWPDRYTATLLALYSHGRPPDWNESSQGAFDNGIDPRQWDQNGDGIPDGWLLAHGLDPLEAVAQQHLAGTEGLTVAKAFQHNTDPRRLDSDGDGLRDVEEIAGPENRLAGGRFPPTDPARADTAGTGVCDGYLVQHGLDPTDAVSGYGDLDRDGATTLEEFQWSHARHGAAACTDGAGLDPTSPSSGGVALPDGWLIRYGLDPFDPDIASNVTQRSGDGPLPPGVPAPARALALSVADEYAHGRPDTWSEERDGPWWGGTDPTDPDTDGDGLSDAWEIAGYNLRVATEPGPAKAKAYVTVLDPTRADTDGDGAPDLAEVVAGTDGARQDTDFDGLDDGFESNHALLNATRADSAGDHLRDGRRLALLEDLAERYAADPTYICPGRCLDEQVGDWILSMPGAHGMDTITPAQIASLVGPEGNLNGRTDPDGGPVPNLVDPDIDGDGIINGAEVDPAIYAETHFGLGPLGERAATDPINPDTDGDGLDDGWEIRHGLAISGRYSLDPATWDSDDDGVDDGSEDPDGDGIWWNDLRPDGRVARTRSEHDNRREFIFDTDPNTGSSDGDGLLDGWKVFWSLRYPRLDSVPASAPRPILNTAQPADSEDSLIRVEPYWRWSAGDVEAGEQSGGAFTVKTDGGELQLVNVTGKVHFRFHDAQRLETNPYLPDTDGDGMPDWWEDRSRRIPAGLLADVGGCVAGAGPDPAVPDGEADPDGDGVPNAMEYARGGHPLCRDTDMGGVPDGDEIDRGLHPGDPRDDVRLRDTALDTDGDGLTDFVEITQTLTSFLHPDTDGDGLLDGGNVPAADCWAGDGAEARRFLDLGIAYEMPQGGCYRFLGEADDAVGTDPRDPDDAGIGVPAGWIFMKMPDFTASAATSAREHYELGRPHWWQESVHGPWWGGADPQAGSSGGLPDEPIANLRNSLDLDGDGLLDRDATGAPAEDPMPAANAGNAPRPVAGLPAGTDPRDDAADPLLRRLAAQATIDPAPYTFNARNTIEHPGYDPSQDDRPTPCLHAAAPAKVLKGEEATVTGRLLAACGGTDGVAGFAVQAAIAGHVFGVAFTDATGAFEIPLNVSSAARHIDVPDDAASAFRGNLSGRVPWAPDAAAVAPGDATLAVRSYATPSWQRAGTQADLVVEATSVLTVEAPDEAGTGQPVPVRLRLADSGGAPLAHPVHITWNGRALDPVQPRPDDGGAEIQLPAVAPGDAGHITLTARSAPPPGDATTPADTSGTIHVRRTGIVVLDAPAEAVAGGEVHAAGALRSAFGIGAASQRGESGATVTAVLRDGADALSQAGDTTGSDGAFDIVLTVPPGARSGALVVEVSVDGTEEVTGAQASAQVVVRGRPLFHDVSTGTLAAGGEHLVAGRLVEPGGAAIPDAPVTVRLGGGEASTRTGADGSFEAPLKITLRPGPVAQELRFAGDGSHTAAVHRAERSVLSATSLQMREGVVARGADVEVAVVLADANGRGVAGAIVEVAWGSEAARTVSTNGTGVAILQRPGSPDDALGTVVVTADYAGSPAAGLGPSSASATWAVRARATVQVPAAAVAGSGTPTGTLSDAGTGEPLAQRSLTVVVDGQERRVTTDADGRFPVLPTAVPGDAPPDTVLVQVAFAGDAEYPAARTATPLRIVSPVTLQTTAPHVLVTGKEAIVHAVLRDGRGGPASGGDVEVLAGQTPVGSAAAGAATVAIRVQAPVDTPAGPASLRFAYSGSDTHAAAEDTVAVEFVQGTELTVDAQRARSGGITTLRVQLRAGASPVADHPIHLFVGGPTGLQASTDDQGRAVFRVRQTDGEMTFLARAPGTDAFGPAATAGTVEALPPLVSPESALRVLPWIVAGAVIGLAVAVVLVRRSLRKPLAEAFRRAHTALQARGPDEEHILEAYRIVEDAAIALELLARPANTPRGLEEVLQRVLPTATRAPLDRLVGLFEQARYGAVVVGPPERTEALGCLAEIRRALDAVDGETQWEASP